MIIEIPDDNSIVKWKKNDNEDWKSAEISDLIKAYEGRPKGEWKYAEYPNLNKEVYYCSNCDIAFPIEYVLAESINPTIKELTVFEKDSRYNFCPCCGADMRKGDTK